MSAKKALLLIAISILVSACSAPDSANSASRTQFANTVNATEDAIDTSDPEWLQNYCEKVIQDVAKIPVVFDRIRGPNKSFTPLHGTERFAQAKSTTTCQMDYYILPVVEEAFQDIGHTHRNSTASWNNFHTSITASISAQLSESSWRPYEIESESNTAPTGSWTRYNREYSTREYADLYFTKNEEIIFEITLAN